MQSFTSDLHTIFQTGLCSYQIFNSSFSFSPAFFLSSPYMKNFCASMDSEFHLNHDMLFEILSLTTLETLDTCKVVSKELKELIDDSWFLQNYTLRTKNVIGYFVQTLQHNIYFSTFVSIDPTLRIPNISIKCFGNNIRILASSNQGILCCQKYKDRSYEYFVCKPSTRQFVVLPSPKGQRRFFELVALMVLKSNPLHYKIIKYSNARHSPPGKRSYICEIFDSKIWSWRQCENLITEQFTVFGHQPSICIGGVVYWLTDRNTVLAFDSATETHLEFAGPIAGIEDNRSYYKNGRIVEYKGKLGFTCEKYKSDELLLWGLEDRRNYRWEIKRVVGINKEKNRLIGCSFADMALMIGYRDQVYAQSGFYNPMDIFPFRLNWEPVNLEDGCMLSCLEEMIMTGH